MAMLPHEEEAWNHVYSVFVSKIHTNSKTGDVPRIANSSGVVIPNNRYMTSRNYGTDKATGTVTFAYSWSSVADVYKNVSTYEYSWDENSATESINVNGIIKASNDANLTTGWNAVYNGGDPACPASVFAARHSTAFSDTSTIAEVLPSVSPITGRPRPSVLAFSRKATLLSSTYSKKQDGNTNQLAYSFSFAYKSWPYSLPLWFKDVSVTLNKKKSIDIWAQHSIIGKRTGPVHQDMNARGPVTFDVSMNLVVGKRKADQFGKYITTLLSDYSEYLLRQVFLDRSGYAIFNYSSSSGSSQNCYLSNDTFDIDVINGSLSRSVSIVMLSIQD
jgi:hypothetical protein